MANLKLRIISEKGRLFCCSFFFYIKHFKHSIHHLHFDSNGTMNDFSIPVNETLYNSECSYLTTKKPLQMMFAVRQERLQRNEDSNRERQEASVQAVGPF